MAEDKVNKPVKESVDKKVAEEAKEDAPLDPRIQFANEMAQVMNFLGGMKPACDQLERWRKHKIISEQEWRVANVKAAGSVRALNLFAIPKGKEPAKNAEVKPEVKKAAAEESIIVDKKGNKIKS